MIVALFIVLMCTGLYLLAIAALQSLHNEVEYVPVPVRTNRRQRR
jgi:hypothetical protein